MATLSRRFVTPVLPVLLLGSTLLLPGCDWLTGTGEGERKSPYIRSLKISTSRVKCGTTYGLAFEYDDLQGDIAMAIVSKQREGTETSTEDTFPFPEGVPLNRGTWTIDDHFNCDDTKGSYKVTVRVEDDGGHKSNDLTGSIELY